MDRAVVKASRLRKRLLDIRNGFWLRPIVMLVTGVIVGVIATNLDHHLFGAGTASPFAGTVSPGGARALLSVAAGALATTLAISLSMTMVTVQLASSQYTPRLLRRFLSDRITQRVLGAFLGTIAYQFMVLRAVRSPDEGDFFVPFLSLGVAVVATLLCLAVLVVFLHRTMRSMQASTIIASIGRETVAMIERLEADALQPLAHALDGPSQTVRADAVGYIQLLDDSAVRSAIGPSRVAIRRDSNPGDFILPGTPLITVFSGPPLPEATLRAVRESFTLGRERTSEADIMFGVRQLVDMALKALSPGINDVTTAVMVVNELGVIAGALARTHLLEDVDRVQVDAQGGMYVSRDLSLESYFELAFGEIVAAASRHPRVHRRILDIIKTLESVEPPARTVLQSFARKVFMSW